MRRCEDGEEAIKFLSIMLAPIVPEEELYEFIEAVTERHKSLHQWLTTFQGNQYYQNNLKGRNRNKNLQANSFAWVAWIATSVSNDPTILPKNEFSNKLYSSMFNKYNEEVNSKMKGGIHLSAALRKLKAFSDLCDHVDKYSKGGVKINFAFEHVKAVMEKDFFNQQKSPTTTSKVTNKKIIKETVESDSNSTNMISSSFYFTCLIHFPNIFDIMVSKITQDLGNMNGDNLTNKLYKYLDQPKAPANDYLFHFNRFRFKENCEIRTIISRFDYMLNFKSKLIESTINQTNKSNSQTSKKETNEKTDHNFPSIDVNILFEIIMKFFLQIEVRYSSFILSVYGGFRLEKTTTGDPEGKYKFVNISGNGAGKKEKSGEQSLGQAGGHFQISKKIKEITEAYESHISNDKFVQFLKKLNISKQFGLVPGEYAALYPMIFTRYAQRKKRHLIEFKNKCKYMAMAKCDTYKPKYNILNFQYTEVGDEFFLWNFSNFSFVDDIRVTKYDNVESDDYPKIKNLLCNIRDASFELSSKIPVIMTSRIRGQWHGNVFVHLLTHVDYSTYVILNYLYEASCRVHNSKLSSSSKKQKVTHNASPSSCKKRK